MRFYSQYGQDKYIYREFFNKKTHGVFVEVGADDGIDRSNTYFFETEMEWTGLCVEPSPTRFVALRQNRNCYCENCCVYNYDGIVDFFDIIGCGKGLSGIINEYNKEHNKRINKELAAFGSDKSISHKISVPCFTLDTLLRKYQIHKIDFCSIDTEGSELNILKTIDFNKFDFDIIMVENNMRERDTSIKSFMEAQKFKMIKRIVADEVYQKIR